MELLSLVLASADRRVVFLQPDPARGLAFAFVRGSDGALAFPDPSGDGLPDHSGVSAVLLTDL